MVAESRRRVGSTLEAGLADAGRVSAIAVIADAPTRWIQEAVPRLATGEDPRAVGLADLLLAAARVGLILVLGLPR